MKLLVNELKSNKIEYISNEIIDKGNYYYVKSGFNSGTIVNKEYEEKNNGVSRITDKYVLYEVEEIPSNVEPEKYCYTPEKGFYKNEDYVYTYSDEERISALEDMMNEIILGGM